MRTLLTLILVGCLAAPEIAAQWSLGPELVTLRYAGTARDTGSLNAQPSGGLMTAFRVSRYWARWGAGLRISYSRPGLAVGKQGVNIIDKTTGSLLEVSAAASTRVGGIGPSGAVRLEVGPALHLWDFDGEYRKRIGAVAAAAYEWPVSARFTGSVRLEGMLSSSWFDAMDVPPEFERHATWRYGVGLGLRYRLSGG